MLQLEGNPISTKQVRAAGKKGTRQQKSETEKEFEREFKGEWPKAFKKRFGVDYLFQGKDWRAIERLAKTKQTVPAIIAAAAAAWDLPDKFLRSQAQGSIAQFEKALNGIQAELARIETPALPT